MDTKKMRLRYKMTEGNNSTSFCRIASRPAGPRGAGRMAAAG